MPSSPLYIRELWYRDNHGWQQMVRIESTDPAELARVATLYGKLGTDSLNEDLSWSNGHTTFTDAEIEPARLDEAMGTKEHSCGFPWDRDDERYCFAVLIGEGSLSHVPSTWHTHTQLDEATEQPETSRYGDEAVKGGPCPLHGDRPLPLTRCCLRCCRTGRDVAIPRPTTWDLKRRNEAMPGWKPPMATKVPPPLKDRTGKVLRGGCGERAKATA